MNEVFASQVFGLVLHFECVEMCTLQARIMDSCEFSIPSGIENDWESLAFVSTLKVHCDVVGHTVSTHTHNFDLRRISWHLRRSYDIMRYLMLEQMGEERCVAKVSCGASVGPSSFSLPQWLVWWPMTLLLPGVRHDWWERRRTSQLCAVFGDWIGVN